MTPKTDDLRARLIELDGELLNCPPSPYLGQLEGKRDAIRDKPAAIVYPVLELPPEIVSEIFIHSLPVYSATPDPLRAPLLLAAICSDWRKIALSTPSLWSCFILSINLWRATHGSTMIIQLFECWLSRSGGCPLTITIGCYAPSPSDSRSAPLNLFSLPDIFIHALSRSSSRWHDMNLVLPYADFYRLQADEGLSLLKRLAIKASDTGLENPTDSPLP
ncbi:hypothetical protein B0H10DRAFT_1112903 [Mycena sp. CBHHK59/15]|nr:hypothetical protein B0H10DRAFT_1112903 [Mycena sp. CBHHK59/15]